MKFFYPAVITKKEEGFYVKFPDLEKCEAFGEDLEDALENARYEGVNWILTELEFGGDLPASTHKNDISLNDNQTVRELLLRMPREGWDE